MTTQTDLQNPLWTALITPMTASGQPDLSSLEALLREQEKAGNGVLILGSTGEALNIGESERQLIVEFTMSLELSVPVMAGVGGHHLPDVISWLCYLETKAVDAYLMVTPIYAKPGSQGQYHWFTTLMDFVSRPVMLYNVPGRTGTSLHLETVERLREHRNFWAIKEASGSVEEFRRYCSASENARVYSGDDAMLPEFAPHGAAGVVSVAGNVWPEATRLFCELALDNQLSDGERSFWQEASKALFVASNPVPTKALLCAGERIRTGEVKLPLHRDDMTRLDYLRSISDQVTTWYAQRTRAIAEVHSSG